MTKSYQRPLLITMNFNVIIEVTRNVLRSSYWDIALRDTDYRKVLHTIVSYNTRVNTFRNNLPHGVNERTIASLSRDYDIESLIANTSKFNTIGSPPLQEVTLYYPSTNTHTLNQLTIKHLRKFPINTIVLSMVSIPTSLPCMRRMEFNDTIDYNSLDDIRELIIINVYDIDHSKLPSSISYLTIVYTTPTDEIKTDGLFTAKQLNLYYLRTIGITSTMAHQSVRIVVRDTEAGLHKFYKRLMPNLEALIYTDCYDPSKIDGVDVQYIQRVSTYKVDNTSDIGKLINNAFFSV